ncbi:GNAT family N-acetyltransferase [Paenibacillus sp. sptzw28]|uniref:GNAT family N-acetyltransferase n=1 Tax=Paenibacillus sp. sptzw28 TaxID=715179 RepID=UPI001C6E6271|nr:GNAT family N-acetyltransferase [Paenibacillus sp. sptzw28]QYR22553.1 GNAT family N-acetyltransferase [Paenibacillus sp. sptzw28]
MILETNRLIIRDFKTEDLEDVHVYASNPLVVEHMIWGPNSIEDTQSFINRVIEMQKEVPRQGFEFAVVIKASNRLIGGCGIHLCGQFQGEIGYCFNHLFWGNGFATEAAGALIEFGFRELGLHRIYATCRPDNIGSASVMKKVGMIYEGHIRGHMFHKGKWNDSYQYSILENEYSKEG